jgi:hypothetical protein
LSESNRKTINHRLLITTTDRIGANARQVLDGQEKSEKEGIGEVPLTSLYPIEPDFASFLTRTWS